MVYEVFPQFTVGFCIRMGFRHIAKTERHTTTVPNPGT